MQAWMTQVNETGSNCTETGFSISSTEHDLNLNWEPEEHEDRGSIAESNLYGQTQGQLADADSPQDTMLHRTCRSQQSNMNINASIQDSNSEPEEQVARVFVATSNLYGQTQEQLDAADAQIANSFSFHQTAEGNWETDSDTEQNAEASTAAAPRADPCRD